MADVHYEYFTLGLCDDPKVAILGEFDGIDGDYRLDDGERMGDRFPPSVSAIVDKQYGDRLTDFLANPFKMVVASERATDLFKSEGLDDEVVEYLPFRLKNKKGAAVKTPRYCVAHPLRLIPCMDPEGSEFDALDDGSICNIGVLKLLADQIPNDAKFFRLKELPRVILLRSDLLNKIEAARLTGLNLAAMGEKIW